MNHVSECQKFKAYPILSPSLSLFLYQLKQLEEKKSTELKEKLKEHVAIERVLKEKIRDLEKAEMESTVVVLRKERDEAKEDIARLERNLRDLTDEFSDLREQLRLAMRPWYKKLFGIDGERKPSK